MKNQIKFGALLFLAGLIGFCPVIIRAWQADAQDDDDAHKLPSLIRIETTGYKARETSKLSEKGEALFKDLNCMACHSIRNVGGRIGPMLDGIGAHRSEEYLYALLARSSSEEQKFAMFTNPHAKLPYHPRLSEPSARAIVDFLLTLPEPAGGFIVVPHIPRRPAEKPEVNRAFKPSAWSSESAEGQEIYNKTGCAACHSINKVGGWLGPALDGIGGRHDRQYILERISNPASAAQLTQGEYVTPPDMPSFSLSSAEKEKIAAYLLSLPNDK